MGREGGSARVRLPVHDGAERLVRGDLPPPRADRRRRVHRTAIARGRACATDPKAGLRHRDSEHRHEDIPARVRFAVPIAAITPVARRSRHVDIRIGCRCCTSTAWPTATYRSTVVSAAASPACRTARCASASPYFAELRVRRPVTDERRSDFRPRARAMFRAHNIAGAGINGRAAFRRHAPPRSCGSLPRPPRSTRRT